MADQGTRRASTDANLWNEDLAPTSDAQRTWHWANIAALWISMVICVPAYLLASGLIDQGMSWWQAVLTVFLGNFIVLIPMLLIGHVGTKYGIPFPVMLRVSFGTVGAKVPALLRGLVACGWFGIQTWVGGSAIYQILNAISHSAFMGAPLPLIGIDIAQVLCFLGFWALQVVFIVRGTESIRWIETLAAPFLLLAVVGLLLWAVANANGLGSILSQPSAFAPGGAKQGQFWQVFWPALTAMVGFWATIVLNIPDFTRFARSQKDQVIGQFIGLPIPMALLGVVSVIVTSATVVIFGHAIWDPVAIAARLDGSAVILGLIALSFATLTTNLAANVVAPANGFSNLAPKRISFTTGGLITAGIGIAIMPWKLMESAATYLFTWLVGYSSLLGPIAGIIIVDYLVIRKTEIAEQALFQNDGQYAYYNGWNIRGFIALVIAVIPNLPGFLFAAGITTSVAELFHIIYNYAWFVGAFLGGVIYYLLMRSTPQRGGKKPCA